jgi:hypothetical protein
MKVSERRGQERFAAAAARQGIITHEHTHMGKNPRHRLSGPSFLIVLTTQSVNPS